MCELGEDYKGKTATGYKIAAEKDGRYYSIFTNVEYKPGELEIIPHEAKVLSYGVNTYFAYLLHHSAKFKPYYKYTSVFRRLKDARKSLLNVDLLFPDYTLVLLKMTIHKELKHGIMHWNVWKFPVIAGKKIVSIKEIKY